MTLSKQAIEEFKEIYCREFKKEISDVKAQELAESLFALFKAICHRIPQENDPRSDCDMDTEA